jgi:hypothetical protein
MGNMYFYGERGIVNGLVLDIKDDLSRLKAALNAINWCKRASRGWIEQIKNATYFVEPGFAQFGQPDLLIICEVENGPKHFLIIEAKAVPYKASAMSCKAGMTARGFNSSVNGQLSLNYRLALALEESDRESILQESEELFQAYQKKLSDLNNGPRKLIKPLTIKGIVKPHLQGAKLDQFHFVAMTNDPDDNQMNEIDNDLKPLLLGGAGNDLWPELAAQFGCLSLEKLDLVVLKIDGYFRQGCLTHIGQWPKKPKAELQKPPAFQFVNWKAFPENWVEMVNLIAQCVKGSTHAGVLVKKYNGSYSLIVNGKTVGKLMLKEPANPKIVVGFSTFVPRAEEYAEILGIPELRVMMKQPFFLVACSGPAKVCETMAAFLKTFEEVA